jgi:hypothetical protein
VSSFIFVNPSVQVAQVQEYAAVGADHGQFAASNHVLHGFFGPAQVDGGLLCRQQSGPHSGAIALLGKVAAHSRRYPFGQGVNQRVKVQAVLHFRVPEIGGTVGRYVLCVPFVQKVQATGTLKTGGTLDVPRHP